jgi:hypothetical protein
MKHLLVFALAIILTGCSALAPVPPTAAPTTTPRIVVQTVIVTVIVTVTPTNTQTPTLTPIPTFTPRATALTPTSSTAETAATALTSAAAVTSPTATLPADAGGGIFTDLTRSDDHFSLRCQPDTIKFGLSTTNSSVAEVDLFYRMEDQTNSSISDWVDIGKMTPGDGGSFTYDFQSSLVSADLRSHRAWFDYQFVALSSQGQVLGRSAKIVKQITYTIDCSD